MRPLVLQASHLKYNRPSATCPRKDTKEPIMTDIRDQKRRLWGDTRIEGVSLRFSELDYLEAAAAFPNWTDEGDFDGPAVPKVDDLDELLSLARRVRACWPQDIGNDATKPLKMPKPTEAALRSDLAIAGALLSEAGELGIEFPLNAPTIVSRSFRAVIVLELNTLLATWPRMRRCAWCDGIYPVQRASSGAGYCSDRCRRSTFKAKEAAK